MCRIYERKTHADRDRNDASIEVPVEDNSLWVTPMFQATAQYNEDSTEVLAEDSSLWIGPMHQATTYNEVPIEDNSSWDTYVSSNNSMKILLKF